MNTNVTNELIYEILKDIQGRMGRFERGQQEVKSELQAIRGHMHASQLDIANLYTSIRDIESDMDSVKTRLQLGEPLQ